MKKEKLWISENELDILKKHLRDSNLSDYNKQKLLDELDSAHVLADEKLPKDAIRIDALVEIMEVKSGRKYVFQIVTPAHADMSKNRISVFAPMGIALLGYRTGAKVQWEMPDGLKDFEVLKVEHKELVV